MPAAPLAAVSLKDDAPAPAAANNDDDDWFAWFTLILLVLLAPFNAATWVLRRHYELKVAAVDAAAAKEVEDLAKLQKFGAATPMWPR